MPSRRSLGAAAALVVALLVVTAGFVGFADATALSGQTNTSASTGTARANDATASLSGPVALYVAGDGWLETAIADDLERTLRARGATVTRVHSLAAPTGQPLLAVRVTDADVRYRPLSPSATLAASFAYLTSGNATLADDLLHGEVLVIRSARDAYVVGGDVSLRDRTSGFATWPAYQRRVATATVTAMVDQLAAAPGMR